MDGLETRQEIRRLRYRAEQWRVIMKHFLDAKTIAALAETAAELDQKADALIAGLTGESDAA